MLKIRSAKGRKEMKKVSGFRFQGFRFTRSVVNFEIHFQSNHKSRKPETLKPETFF